MFPTVGSTALPAGTHVALASGKPCRIEDLAPGTVLDGGAVVASVAELPLGSIVDAIRIAAGALAPESPSTDLVLSPRQWVAFGARLAPAGVLANGVTIRRAESVPAAWYALAADRPATVIAAGVSLPLPGPAGLGDRFRPLTPGPELAALRASLHPPPPPSLRVMLGARELPADLAADRVEAKLPSAEGAPMLVLRLVSPPGRPRGTRDLRHFGVAIREVALDGEALALEDPGFGDGFYPVERREAAAWRWTNGEATLALPPSDAPRVLTIHLTPWHTQLEPA
jgi:hypothetical protein